MLAESRISDPVTLCPAVRKRRAIPLIPEPPIPTKCSAPALSGSRAEESVLIRTLTRYAFRGLSGVAHAVTVLSERGCTDTLSANQRAHPIGAVSMPDRGGGGGHLCPSLRITQQRDQLCSNPVRHKRGVI